MAHQPPELTTKRRAFKDPQERYEMTAEDLKYAEEQAWNYIYDDHAGMARETAIELNKEHNATTLMFLWFMERINFHA